MSKISSYNMAYQQIGYNGFLFKQFTNIAQYYKYHTDIEDSHHYEIISGSQCLYFDFEGKEDVHETDFPELAKVIEEKFKKFPLRIDCYTSSGLDKFSYHIIVKGIYFYNHIATKIVADEIIRDISHANMLKKLYDDSVYSSKRNLRLVGSRKLNSIRVKKFLKTIFQNKCFTDLLESDNSQDLHLLSFRLSLASDTYLCMPINIETPNVPEKVFENNSEGFNENDLKDINSYLDENYPGVFKREKTDKTFIKLTRMKPHHCNICERVHSNDNAFVFKMNEKNYFGCYRDSNKNYSLIEKEVIDEVKFVPRNIVRNEETKEDLHQKIAKKLLRAFPY